MDERMPGWVKGFPGAVTLSGVDGKILYMNDRAAKTFESSGGRALVGSELAACHNERSRAIIARILETGEPHVYTIEKKGQRKLIFQAPWYDDGALGGLVELSLVLPEGMPHYKRD
ncbi:MAG TPA: hypothetical protein PLB91_04580 [Spirochaetales bacterium]|nr:hypothetical protein [Spirochaetales bacterium]HRY54197.1 diguanylate cyclase [Spirochaetia bacterium]HRZ64829.1 diguanylate cyclase [Spirochaetia bacterium]